MADKSESGKIFECYYTDAPLFDRIYVWSLSICFLVALALIPKAGNIYPIVIFSLVFMLIPLWFEFVVHMIRTRGTIELTDNEIIYRRWMCRHKSFPIDKIESIRVVDFDQDEIDKLTQDYMLPMPMGRVNLYPQSGVIVFFERKWIKSVRPIFFNPAEPEQFAMALSEASGKPVSIRQQRVRGGEIEG